MCLTLACFDSATESTSCERRVALDELVSELEPVINWFVLGLHLGVPLDILRQINGEHFGVEYSRIMMLSALIENCTTELTWSRIISALTTMGELRLAKSITSKIG